MRNAFVKTLVDIARTNDRIFLLVGDLGYSVVEPFSREFPKRFINVGVAEQNMTGIAAGLALSGKIVFTYSIANFPTLRCLEQIRNDVCYHNANVKIVSVGSGLAYGSQGMTHHATEDLSIMRTLPNMAVLSPCDAVETTLATQAIVEYSGPCYLRLNKSGEPIIHHNQPEFRIGKALTIRKGKDLTIIATGGITYNALKAAERLVLFGVDVRLLSFPTIKPLDTECIKMAANETRCIVTIEEGTIIGGLGSTVAEVVTSPRCRLVPVLKLGLKDTFVTDVGSQEYLRRKHGLSIDGIYQDTVDFWKSF
jgi:transketolase